MIARVWAAQTTRTLWPGYLEHFTKRVQPVLREFQGYAGSTLGTRATGEDGVEIVVTTFWNSLKAIDKFAGPDRESAVVADEAVAFLTDYERRVRHYEVKVADFGRGLQTRGAGV